ncbi:cobalt-zinc-cadmium resistance protein [Cupriavidus sp.]|uniref:cobalt-zinc-cadmium resistance protein n=1 Tax=Cupriavidus sp. TaxID=1873897 RepID=UPI003D0B6A46
MRSLLLLLTVLCLSLLSFGAAAGSHAGAAGAAFESAQAERLDPLDRVILESTLARTLDELDGGADLERVVAPGDDGLPGESAAELLAEDDNPPGYCEIWSADLLDPLDMLDEIEESSALFALPTVRVSLPPNEIAQQLPARPEPLPAAFFKPPISLI